MEWFEFISGLDFYSCHLIHIAESSDLAAREYSRQADYSSSMCKALLTERDAIAFDKVELIHENNRLRLQLRDDANLFLGSTKNPKVQAHFELRKSRCQRCGYMFQIPIASVSTDFVV